MLQWTNRLMGCTKSTISIRFDVQLKNDFDFDFDDRNISSWNRCCLACFWSRSRWWTDYCL